MTSDQFNRFVKPGTDHRLLLRSAVIENGQVRSGQLVDEKDNTEFPVRDFIPSFVRDSGYVANFGFQWQRHANLQLDSFNGSTYSRDRLYRTAGWDSDRRLEGNLVLEAGSGAGRFTEILARTGATIYSFDYSEAASANFANNGRRREVAIFRADIYAMPFMKKQFDYVFCLGVLQHTPRVHDSFRCLADMVRPGGQLVVDVYPRTWRHLLHWKYLLRPFTTRMKPETLYRVVSHCVPRLIPLAGSLHRVGGRVLRRLVPIMDQSDKNLAPEHRREWAILDTFDALGARYDQPQSGATIRKWFREAGFREVIVDDEGVTAVGTVP